MSRSSIFNFESLQGLKPRVPWTLLGVLAVLGSMELFVRNVSDDWLLSDDSRLGVFRFMEREVISQYDEPQILVLGSSRSADAVVPKLLDEKLGLDEATVNLGIPAGRAYDALAFYERNRARLSKAKLVILNLDEWYFSSGWGLNARFQRFASLEDRWHLVTETRVPRLPGDTDEGYAKKKEAVAERLHLLRNTYLADWALQMRLKLRYVPSALALNLGLGTKKSQSFDENRQVRTSSKDVGREVKRPEKFHKRIHGFYRDFDTHPLLVEHVERLARMVREDGGRLVLLQFPNRGMHQQEVEKLYPLEFEQHVAELTALAERIDAPLYLYRYPKEIGLPEIGYEDYGHMAFQGAQTFTAWLAELIETDGLLEPEQSAPNKTGFPKEAGAE